ncbi:MAG TPA: hypothetical protein VD861_00305, partial [Pyrinomonadaceae bacterium]|nr:hypothetical protein [Pyrinomonadaceae bacterium]
ICCRVDEFLQLKGMTGQDAPVAAKVEVLDLTKPQVLLALEHARIDRDIKHHAAAKNLEKLLVKKEYNELLEVLCTPFYFTIALEIFDQPIPEDNDFRGEKDKLKTRLIKRFVERKLENTPNPKTFKAMKTHRWLKWLAERLEKNQNITFELADLQPNNLKRAWAFKLAYGIVAYLFLSVTLVIFAAALAMTAPTNDLVKEFQKFKAQTSSTLLALIFMFSYILLAGLALGAFIFLPFCLLFGFRTKEISTEDASQFSLKPLLEWKTWKAILLTSILYGSISLLMIVGIALALGAKAYSLVISGALYICLWIASAALIERVSHYCRVVKKFGELGTDYQRIKTGIVYNLVRWAAALACFTLILSFFTSQLWRSFLVCLPFAIMLGLLNR